MQGIKEGNKKVIEQLCSFIQQINNDDYSKKLAILSGSSVGMHVRHILEFYSCFLDNLSAENICYDKRERQLIYEVDTQSTISKFNSIINNISKLSKDLPIILNSNAQDDEVISETITSSCSRELLYTLDHAIHHMALIKIAVNFEFKNIKLADNFGVAPSTIRYQNSQCAQ